MSDVEIPRHDILGVRVSALDYGRAVDAIVAAARDGRGLGVTALAVHGVMTGYQDLRQRHRLNALDVVTPDGQPVRWALNRIHGAGLRDRVYGPTLMLKVCEAAAREALPVFLFGATEQTLEKLSANLRQRFPGLVIAGTRASAFRQLDAGAWEALAREIRDSGAQLVFVGLGCPRQETWVYEMREHLPMPRIAVGAAFDFHAGNAPQAPRWMQGAGLEWLYRLCGNPRRLWKRYLLLNPQYVLAVLLQWAGVRRADPDSGREPEEQCRYG